MAPRQISITSSFSRFASRRSVANLSMAQKQIAPTTIMVKIDIRIKIIVPPVASVFTAPNSEDRFLGQPLGHMLSMPPADSVIGWLLPRHDSPPAHAGWLISRGPALTPDGIVASLIAVTLSFTKTALPPVFTALLASARMWSQGSMARKNETEEAFTHTEIPSGNVRDMKYCLRFSRSNRLSAVSPTSCGPPESPRMFVIEPLRLDDDPKARGKV